MTVPLSLGFLRGLGALALLGLGAATVSAQDTLEGRLGELMARAQVPGLQLTVIADGRVARSLALGVRSVDTGAPVTAVTVFEAASLSKPLFAYVVLQLVDQGLLDLDRPLSEYFDYPDLSHDERVDAVTARMIMGHTSGLPNWRGQDERLEFVRAPGQTFGYSGEGFVYLQRSVEHVTGESIEMLARRLVFEPLGMDHSSYRWTQTPDADVALGHNQNGTVRSKRDVGEEANAAWSLHTTAEDYSRFLLAVLRGDRLSDSLRAALMVPLANVVADEDDGPGDVMWGLGWGLEDGEPHGWGMWHWGHNGGYRAFVVGFPADGTGVVLFSNSDNGMLLLADALALTVPGEHPAVQWLDYESWDDPGRLVRLELEEVIRVEGIEAGIERFRLLRADQPEAFDEATLNGLGYALLRSGLVADAIIVFQMNVAMYPTSSNPYDSLGEAYFEAGDYARALANYRSSVRLNPANANGRRMIERIEREQRAGG
jgi:CubicO group peptidase (beta-lactamase class C family)